MSGVMNVGQVNITFNYGNLPNWYVLINEPMQCASKIGVRTANIIIQQNAIPVTPYHSLVKANYMLFSCIKKLHNLKTTLAAMQSANPQINTAE
jgi:hypothetical protein